MNCDRLPGFCQDEDQVREDPVERRFSDEELRSILEDATRSQRLPSPSLSRGAGHTLAEIREIAQEAGIDPDEVERAAANLVAAESRSAAPPPTRTLGFNLVLHEELVIPRPLKASEMRSVAMQPEILLGQRGTFNQGANWAEWRDSRDRLYVGVVRGAEKTRIRLIADQSGELIRGAIVIGVPGILVIPVVLNLGAASLVIAGGVTYGLIALYARWRTRVTRKYLRELLDILKGSLGPG
jgi:hypothetical protein